MELFFIFDILKQNKGVDYLSDSNITKQAFAIAFKKLMEELPFSKISVTDICKKSGMNRKSFYYHFKDKYDLVNWIYDTDFIVFTSSKSFSTGWDFLEGLCYFFYENRSFYRKALKIKGQNSFTDHLQEFLVPVISEYLKPLFPAQKLQKFYVNFFADAFICAIERWILEKDCIPPEQFFQMLKSCAQAVAVKISKDMD